MCRPDDDDLKDARAEAFERLCALVFCADLRKIKGVPHFVLDVLRTRPKRRQRVAEPDHRLWRRLLHANNDMLNLACVASEEA